jgi:hypothetical protein
MLYHSRSSHWFIGYPLELLGRLRRGEGWIDREAYFRIYDGAGNPLGRAYSRGAVRRLFAGMEILEQQSYETYRPRLGRAANRLLLALGRRFGFYLVTRARKPETP